jgi:hypothetical protein
MTSMVLGDATLESLTPSVKDLYIVYHIYIMYGLTEG